MEYVRLVLSSAMHDYVIWPTIVSSTYAELIIRGMIKNGIKTYPNMIIIIQTRNLERYLRLITIE